MIRLSEEDQGFEDTNTPPCYIVRIFLFILRVQWEFPLELGLCLGPLFSLGMKGQWKYTASVKIIIIRLKLKYMWLKYCHCDTIHYKDHTDSPGSKSGHPNWETARTIGGLLTVHMYLISHARFIVLWEWCLWKGEICSAIEQTADCLDSCGLSRVNRQC
jgi:hypothetical protein